MYLNPDTRRLIKIKPYDLEQSLAIVGTSDAKKDLMIKNKVITLDTIDLGELYGYKDTEKESSKQKTKSGKKLNLKKSTKRK